jgi:hypothetical protein
MANNSSETRAGVIRCLLEIGAYNFWVGYPVWASVANLESFPDQFRRALNAHGLQITSITVAQDSVCVDVTAGPANCGDSPIPTIVNGRSPWRI